MKKILPFILLSALLLSSCSADEGISFSEFAKNEIKKEDTSFYTVIKNEETGEEFFELKKQEIPVSSIIKKEYSDRLSALSEFEYSSLSEDEKLLYDILQKFGYPKNYTYICTTKNEGLGFEARFWRALIL